MKIVPPVDAPEDVDAAEDEAAPEEEAPSEEELARASLRGFLAAFPDVSSLRFSPILAGFENVERGRDEFAHVSRERKEQEKKRNQGGDVR